MLSLSSWLKQILLISCCTVLIVNSKVLLTLEGNTGAGKTTLINLLQREFDAEIIPEPVEEWQDINGCGNLMDLSLNHSVRWGYTFENYVLITHIKACLQANQFNKMIHILDRSVYSAFYGFSRMLLDSGSITDLEWNLLKEQFEFLIYCMPQCKPDGFIYLRTSPEICLQRTIQRNRSEENNLSIDFFNGLHTAHDDWLLHKRGILDYVADIPVLLLDGDCDFKDDLNIQKDYIQKVRKFIECVAKQAFVQAESLN